jgi:hypothetical protein
MPTGVTWKLLRIDYPLQANPALDFKRTGLVPMHVSRMLITKSLRFDVPEWRIQIFAMREIFAAMTSCLLAALNDCRGRRALIGV